LLAAYLICGLLVVCDSHRQYAPAPFQQHNNTQDRRRLFRLLSDHPPRDLEAPEIALLRALPLYARLRQPDGDSASSSASSEGGDEGGGELVALGARTDWLLVPDRCLEQLGGESWAPPAGVGFSLVD